MILNKIPSKTVPEIPHLSPWYRASRLGILGLLFDSQNLTESDFLVNTFVPFLALTWSEETAATAATAATVTLDIWLSPATKCLGATGFESLKFEWIWYDLTGSIGSHRRLIDASVPGKAKRELLGNFAASQHKALHKFFWSPAASLRQNLSI